MSVARRSVALALLAVLLAAVAHGQVVRTNVYSRPEVPSREALDRLNLDLAWKYYVPLESTRDGILRAEFDYKDLFVLTRAGTVVCLDAETGRVKWRTTVGKPYSILPFLAVNSRGVGVIANVELFGLDRANGRKMWEYRLPAGISAAPVVDEKQIYIPSSDGRIYAFSLPFFIDGKSVVYGEQRGQVFEERPRPVWEEQTNMNLSYRPLLTRESIFVVDGRGRALGLGKRAGTGDATVELFRYTTDNKVSVPPGQFGDVAYVGTDGGTTYALNAITGKVRWRHSSGSAVVRRPASVADDVFVTSDREGMSCVIARPGDEREGESRWKIPCGRGVLTAQREADEFLACNSRFVYASDRSGRLLVLDRKRGVRLSWLDTTAFRVKIVNEVTDRLYLAAQDGLIVCLHDRDQREPIRHRARFEEERTPLSQALEEKIKEPEGKPEPFKSVIRRLEKQYKLVIVVAEKEFKDANLPDVREKEVTTPPWEDRLLKDYLKRILEPLNATYDVQANALLIRPVKQQPPPKQ